MTVTKPLEEKGDSLIK